MNARAIVASASPAARLAAAAWCSLAFDDPIAVAPVLTSPPRLSDKT